MEASNTTGTQSNGWFDGALFGCQIGHGVTESAEMSFRSAGIVPTKI